MRNTEVGNGDPLKNFVNVSDIIGAVPKEMVRVYGNGKEGADRRDIGRGGFMGSLQGLL